MAWNGSGGNVAPKKTPTKSVGGAPALRGIIALVAVVAIGVGVYLFVSDDKKPMPKESAEETTEKGAIEAVAPELTTVPAAQVEVKQEVPKKPKKYWEEDVMPANLTPMQQRKWKHAHRPPPGYTNDTSRTEAPPSYAIFEHHSENTIAGYLTIVPGETLVGTPHYGEKFKKDFMESMEHPIIITAEDTPEQAELKQAMIDTKIELADRIRAGEDLGDILLETHEEYQRLASLKSEFQQEFNRFKNDPYTTMQDVEDFLAVANKVLEEKGVAPLTLSPISRHMLMRRKGVK